MTNLIKYLVLFGFGVLLIACNKTLQVVDSSSSNNKVEATTATSRLADSLITPYRDSMEVKMNTVLNQTLVDLEVGVPEGLMGNFVTDLTFARVSNYQDFNADFCILNNGGFRTSILKGDITRGSLFELMPFENEVVIIEISAEKMVDLIEYIRVKSLEAPSRKSGVPVSNIRVTMSKGEVTNVMINNVQYNKNKTYRVATTDYLAGGGDDMNFFLNPIKTEKTGLKLRDLIIDHVVELKKRNRAVNLALDGRIYHAE